MPDRRLTTFVCALLAVSLVLPALALAVTSSAIESELMCDCGCGDILVNCTCERSEEMRAIIAGMIDRGMTRDEVIQAFVDQFGEVILSAPPRKGFNLVAYTVPTAGLFLFTMVAVVFVRRWKGSGRKWEGDPTGEEEDDLSDEVQRRIDEELARIEED